MGIKEGKGIFYYSNGDRKGDKFKGNWIKNLSEGRGVYIYIKMEKNI